MRLTIEADQADGLDARDRAELARFLLEALEAAEDEHACRPMRRARLLLARSRIVARQGQGQEP